MRAKGCLACHSIDGKPMVGPTFRALYGRQQEVLTLGQPRTVAADEAYLRVAIQEPMKDVVKGYPPAMPPAPLTAQEVAEMVTYLKTLK